ncbi:hypothetical protein CRG98_037793 [Punica granatum]|uniref:Uncharacterized protein n=1 Tax=Punica granatum TaxID=22663 RepID=A0A2I0ICW8_PUNGR|nr:hypothetical protein CRG98_037793 [Punica granatum]
MPNPCPPGKSSWPELIGTDGEAAAPTIEKDNPNVKASIVKEGNLVTPDFHCDRVCVYVNDSGIVTRAPSDWLINYVTK